MKLLLVLACMITLSLKTIGQDHPYDDLTTMREASTHFADSLLSRGVDTFISYYAGSASCPSVPPIAVVYWKENNMGNMLVFGVIRHSHKRKKESFSLLLEYIDGIGGEYFLSYADQYFSRLKNDTVRNNEILYVFNHTFEELKIKLGAKSLTYSFNTAARESNPDSFQILFVDKFRSFVLGRYLPFFHYH